MKLYIIDLVLTVVLVFGIIKLIRINLRLKVRIFNLQSKCIVYRRQLRKTEDTVWNLLAKLEFEKSLNSAMLPGKTDSPIESLSLKEQMQKAIEAENFELAEQLKHQIEKLKNQKP